MTYNPTVAMGSRYQSPYAPGSARMFDIMWPTPNDYKVGAVAASRNDFASTPNGPSFTSFGGGGGNSAQCVAGVPCHNLASSAVVGNGNGVTMLGLRPLLNTTKNNLDTLSNDLLVWRILFNVALFAPPAASGEVGCYMTTDIGQPRIITSASQGFGFRFLSDGTLVWCAVVGGVPTNTQVLAAYGNDIWHTLEMRMFGATSNKDAYLQVLVDGLLKTIPVTSSSWAVGSLLPGIGAAIGGTASLGFMPAAVCMANNANALRVNQIRIQAGPTLLSLIS